MSGMQKEFPLCSCSDINKYKMRNSERDRGHAMSFFPGSWERQSQSDTKPEVSLETSSVRVSLSIDWGQYLSSIQESWCSGY